MHRTSTAILLAKEQQQAMAAIITHSEHIPPSVKRVIAIENRHPPVTKACVQLEKKKAGSNGNYLGMCFPEGSK